MRLAAPSFLVALPFCLLFLLWISRRKRRGGRFRFSSLTIIKGLPSASRMQPRLLLQVLRALAVMLFIIALARPQSGKRFSEITSEGVDIMLALDTSGSMQAIDMTIDGKPAPRIDVVKKVAAEFVAKRPTDRLGTVVFGETAFLQCPLTLDHSMLVNLMNEIQVGIAGDSTAIGDGIGVSVNHMKGLKAKSKVIILLTDGQNNSGFIPPSKAAELARTFGVKIYTIGVGKEGQAPFLVDTPYGKRVLYQEADLDEETLKQISSITGARFFRAKDSATLGQIYDEIDKLEKTDVKVKDYSEYNELFAWFAFPGLILLLAEIVLGQTVLMKVP